MGNLRDIRRRIKSVKNTSQITRAMQMVASAKMRRAQDQAVKGRPYIRALAEVLYHLQDEIDTSNSPLMQPHGGADLVLLVNTDRGLCGGLNANLIKMVREQAPENAHYITIGRKLNAALAKLNERLEATWSLTVFFLTMWDHQNPHSDFRLFRPRQLPPLETTGGSVIPYADAPNADGLYLQMISKAKRYLYITTPYLAIDETITSALCIAARTGVDVRIMTPHIPDKKGVFAVTQSNSPVLLEAGARIFE